MINFLDKSFLYRLQRANFKNEMLVKALGLKKEMQPKPFIIDGTGGLGLDSAILAFLGFEVTVLERSPQIHALLQQGIEEALEELPSLNHIHLVLADSIQYLADLKTPPDIIYLDPMFPISKKKALSKKEMRDFHEIVGDDLDSDQLLKVALSCALKRVVVKRPRLSDPLASLEPSYSLTGSSNRFDVYLMNRK